MTRLGAPTRRPAKAGANTATTSEETAKLLAAESAKAESVAKNYAKPLDEVRIVLARSDALNVAPSGLTLEEAMKKQRIEEQAIATIERETDDEIARMKAESPEYQRLYGPRVRSGVR